MRLQSEIDSVFLLTNILPARMTNDNDKSIVASAMTVDCREGGSIKFGGALFGDRPAGIKHKSIPGNRVCMSRACMSVPRCEIMMKTTSR